MLVAEFEGLDQLVWVLAVEEADLVLKAFALGKVELFEFAVFSNRS